MKFFGSALLTVLVAIACVAQETPPLPPDTAPPRIKRTLPKPMNAAQQPVASATVTPPPPPAEVVPLPPSTGQFPQAAPAQPQPAVVPPPHGHPPVVATPAQPMNLLKWDAEMKETTVKSGEDASWKFYFTNTSEVPVVIHSASASCGCTVPKLPPLPWTNAPGATGEIPVSMTLAGKPPGITFKTVTINTDKGSKMLTVKVTMEAPPAGAAMVMNRDANQKLAMADRQAIFKGDCRSCHVDKGAGKFGAELYVASCGICHDAEHRASAVPDLKTLPHDTNADYWKTWISQGKPGSMMPAFSHTEGGPLSDAQIASLVQYLTTTIPAQAKRSAGN